MNDSDLERLRALYPSLAGAPPALEALFSHGIGPVTVPRGSTLFEEGDACAGFPLLLEGTIRVAKVAAAGRELQLYRVVPGEACLLTSSSLLGRTVYTARGTAETQLTLAMVAPDLFQRLVEAHAPFRDFVFSLFAERITELLSLVEAVAFQRLDQRLASLLLGRGRLLRTTHQALADELGSVREMVSRLLSQFEDDGLVRLGRERIEILDPIGLRRIAGAV